MTKGLQRTLSRGAAHGASGGVVKTIRVAAVALSVTGATGVGWATAVVGDFPQGNILLLGCTAYLQFTKLAGATGIQATFDGDYSIGTTPTADATLSGTDVNVLPSTALGAATAGVSPVVRAASSGGAMGTILDNTDGSLELNVNLLIDDANISADAQPMTVSGVMSVAYLVLGDD